MKCQTLFSQKKKRKKKQKFKIYSASILIGSLGINATSGIILSAAVLTLFFLLFIHDFLLFLL